MLYNTDAVVVKTVRYGEHSAIVTLLTPSGLVSAMAKGALKPQSRLAAGTRLCAQGTYFLYQGHGMGDIRQVQLTASRRRLHEDIEAAAYAAYFCDLALVSTPERPHAPKAMFTQFSAVLDALELRDETPPDLLARVYEAKICSWLGASPNWERCIRCMGPLVPPAAYHMTEGGLVCGPCRRDVDRSAEFVVPERTGRLLTAFTEVDVRRLGRIQVSPPTRRSLDAILSHQLREFAGLHGKAKDVLDQIIRSLRLD
ncbi:DNA replication and repair protein RecO [Alicyclobacillus sacchari]|uniref:DNA repair protein RecO n=1 Tax=Alicyclobacillus sacchari TaxID=392010 RepID=A0A4R8LR48_9BACL|nr:DNA repair protein RecO [Alicyclobacillus sacchari]TDY48003.1 DNA replication and repair protein RecO [Alicyclobacillus sacchari]GMA56131.1 DNA repair protein RecO [Alicyclobacillus sacchari]